MRGLGGRDPSIRGESRDAKVEQMDIWIKKKRSWVMSRILGKNTQPEIKVRQLLHAMGYRFRIHKKGLPGKPDIVLKKHKAIIFVHGCFWHLHGKCRDGRIPKTNVTFWSKKLLANKKREKLNTKTLQQE